MSVGVTITAAMLAKLDEIASKAAMTRAAFIRCVLAAALDRKGA